MDSNADIATIIEEFRADLRDAIEEAWATRLFVMALTRRLTEQGMLSSNEMHSLIQECVSLGMPNTPISPAEHMLADRLRGRLEAIGATLAAPAGSRSRLQ